MAKLQEDDPHYAITWDFSTNDFHCGSPQKAGLPGQANPRLT